MITASDMKMVEELKRISKDGNSAEVKLDHTGKWVVYEVRKRKKDIE